MEVFEITGYATGVDQSGVNFLQPSDSFQNIENGFIYRQVLQSRRGIGFFAPRLADESRIFGIFEHILPDSTKKLLAFDQNFCYLYNSGTGVFDQIAFGGSMAGYLGFAISSKEFYISGTSYPTAANAGRFVFCGQGIAASGGSSIFFYDDATNTVRNYTSVADNPNYVAPTSGVLASAQYVFWFGERLNFFIPQIGGTYYYQGMLYSGIRNSAGNGDNFNIAGSGLLQADTYEYITGASILGQVMAINFERSNWTVEKTRDAFNPYFIRKVPSVLGTNAKFSAVSWADKVKSIGKTGIIATDGRQSLRVDNKIPNFTSDEISSVDFDLTYGGFDRVDEQFVWAYKSEGNEGDTQDKVLVSNYEFDTWSVYDMRLSVFGQTDIGRNLTWNDIYEVNNPSWLKWETTEELWGKIGIGESVQKTLAGDDNGYIYDFNSDYDDYYATISAITQATSAVVSVSDDFFGVGDKVVIENAEGMTQINNFDPDDPDPGFTPYEITAIGAGTVTLNIDSTQFTAYTTGGSISKVISFSAETIPFNPYRPTGRRVFVSHVEFLIDTNGGFLHVDVFDDEEESPFIDNVLIQPTQTSKAREWVSMTVDQESNFLTFRLRQESPLTQVRVTSMRIHCAPGGLTNG